MIENSDKTTEICSPDSLLAFPSNGRWLWNEKKKELVYGSRQEKSKETNTPSREILKIDLRTGLRVYRKQYRPLERIIKTKANSQIALVDVIQASLNVMSETFYIPIEFEEYLKTSQVHEYLLYLINYFHWLFEATINTSPKIGKQIDRSQTEKDRLSYTYAYLLESLRELGCKYAVLLLGVNLKDFHHMRNGELFRAGGDVELMKLSDMKNVQESSNVNPASFTRKDNLVQHSSISLKQTHVTSLFAKDFNSSSSYRRSFALPAPPHPTHGKQTDSPNIQFELKQTIGILGKPYMEFDPIWLISKLQIEDDIVMPKEFQVTLSDDV
ncbi:unnamed protein product [Adineta ricciae]|uniref:Uncharacterized protein n=1 Tax=Adineta ricciae TaxID=249248 RepID=A0A815WEZ1_ADIRI|nr:unnamed protein product [Adineta ricciae]